MIDPAANISGVPSPISENVKGPPKSSPPFALHPLAFSLITSIPFVRPKHPSNALIAIPVPNPVTSPSKLRW